MVERGIPIEILDPQPEVRRNAENAPDWEYREQAKYLYDRAVLFRDRLIDPIARIDRNVMPDPVISFDNLRNKNTLAAYRLTRNPQGMDHEIIINNQHLEEAEGKMSWRFGEWALNETLLHEQIHLWQQVVGEDPVKLGRVYHNKEFVEKCENVGLHPKLGEGYHTQLADGAFGIVMKELGIEKPEGLAELPPELDIDWFKFLEKFFGKERKGQSTLTKWVCPGCDLKVRVGIKGNPELKHEPCGEVLVRGDIYKANSEVK